MGCFSQYLRLLGYCLVGFVVSFAHGMLLSWKFIVLAFLFSWLVYNVFDICFVSLVIICPLVF